MELNSICFCDWTGYLQSLAKFGTMSKFIKSKINIIYNNNNFLNLSSIKTLNLLNYIYLIFDLTTTKTSKHLKA